MKKLFVAFSLLLFSYVGFSQSVNDQATIPVSVTLNSILRLTVVSGGNIDFVVNTMAQYQNGINNGATEPRYNTVFTVASSRDFNVNLRAEDGAFQGQDNSSANVMDLDNVGFDLIVTPGATGAFPGNWTSPADGNILALEQSPASNLITSVSGSGAGGVDQNSFTIRWRLGTGEGAMKAGSTLLQQSLPPDRYVTNVFLELLP